MFYSAHSRRFHPTTFRRVTPMYRLRAGSTQSRSETSTYTHRVYLAVGSNLGDRFANIQSALKLLCQNETRLVKTSFLYETAPMYVTDQPSFLNGAVAIETNLKPHDLLHNIKRVEREIGRNPEGIRNGPRPVDLDILVYQSKDEGSYQMDPPLETPDLVVPHPRIVERSFVLAPFSDVVGSDFELSNSTLATWLEKLPPDTAVRVLPTSPGMIYFNETVVMGILNVTPDSFSDGGQWTDSVEASVARALEMEEEGATIIDVGGESTRPGAALIPVEEEIRRTVAVIESLRKRSDVAISIDTRKAAVARAAVEAGADIVNDVSGGSFDPQMLDTVADLGVPMILMHMRGTPQNMQSMTNYEDVVTQVGTGLQECSEAAEKHGIHRWLQIVDPGIGFAKDQRGNLLLLKGVQKLREHVGNLPLLIGTSRKGFIGKLSGVEEAQDRDFGSIASVVAALSSGEQIDRVNADIVRVHNVAATRQATLIMDAIKKAR